MFHYTNPWLYEQAVGRTEMEIPELLKEVVKLNERELMVALDPRYQLNQAGP